MRPMALRLTDAILEATEHLPAGATLVVPHVAWDDYERLLENLTERPLRVTFDCGRLEIVSPSPRHERYARFFDDLVRAFAEVHDLGLEKLGQTTWKMRLRDKGIEADSCYYVRNVERVIGKEELDLEFDPPPDIAVEIDITSTSVEKLAVYAALAVPEIWRYDGQTVQIYGLAEAKYMECSGSNILPGLTASILTQFMELSKTQGQTRALKAFRERIKTSK
jgi:Uma2 family endonuclease